jgi:hypothetical protein
MFIKKVLKIFSFFKRFKFPPPSKLFYWATFSLIILIAIHFRFASQQSIPPGLFNDEAVEISQALSLQLDRFKIFVEPYVGGKVWPIEILPVLINKVLLAKDPANYWPIKTLYASLGVLTVIIFFLLLRKIFSPWMALLGTFIAASSAYNSYYERIITRNAITPLWMVLHLLFFYSFFQQKGKRWWPLAGTILFLLLGIHSYTTFKVYAVAFFFIWATWITAFKNWQDLKFYFTGLGLVVLGTFGLAFFSGDYDWHWLLHRGNYVYRFDNLQIAQYFFPSILSPLFIIKKFRGGDYFFADPTHVIFTQDGRGMLAYVWGAVFYIGLAVGLWAIIRRKNHFRSFTAPLCFFSLLVIGTGGPSLKTFFSLSPLIILMTVDGICQLEKIFPQRRYKLGILALVMFLIPITLYDNYYQLFNHCAFSNRNFYYTTNSEVLSQEVDKILQRNPRANIYIGMFMGKDVFHYRFLRSYRNVLYSWPNKNEGAIKRLLLAKGEKAIFMEKGEDIKMVKDYLHQQGYSFVDKEYRWIEDFVLFEGLTTIEK